MKNITVVKVMEKRITAYVVVGNFTMEEAIARAERFHNLAEDEVAPEGVSKVETVKGTTAFAEFNMINERPEGKKRTNGGKMPIDDRF